MNANILATKLHLPFLPPRRVQRPHLVKRLNAGLASGCQLTLISAPAGFGKSTCAGEWLASLDRWPVSWLSLEPSDDDPGRFFSYFVAALQKVDETIGQEMDEVLRTGQLPPIETLITPLLNDILKVERKFFLVLDDFQVIRESSILKALEILINNQPRNMHLVLITREDPQLPLARLRANNQMTEIRAADLRFSSSEANHFMNELMDLSLSETDIAALENRTEGWVVGLQLAGLSMRGRADASNFIASLSGSHRFILGYLTEEVLSRQPETVQQFLLQTSILEKLSYELCNAVTGRIDSGALIEKLFTANLFLIPLDDEGLWFRFHHLFSDLLQARLRQASPADLIAALHLRAAAWFEQNEFVSDAFNHALTARDFEGMARLIEQNADAMMTRGELVTLIRWTEALPDDVIRLHPLILIAKAWALTLAGAPHQVEPLLHQAEMQIEASGETLQARELSGNIAAIRAFFAMMAGEYPRALELAERAETLLPESSVQARSLLPYTLGSAYRGQGQYEKAAEAFARVAQMGELGHALIVWATGVTEVMNIYRVQGRLRDAAETGRQALQRIKEQGAYSFGSLAKVEVALCEVLREQNELDEAHQRVTGVIERMQAWEMPTDRIFAYLALIHIQEAQGDFAGAFEALAVAKNLKAANPVLMALAHGVDFCEIRLCLSTGNISAADRLIDELRPGTSQMVNISEQELIMLARVRLAQGRNDEVAAILAPLSSDAEAGGRRATLLESLALQARVLDAQADRQAAVTLLIKALAIAEPDGFVRIFVDEGEEMQSLVVAAARQMESAIDPALISLKVYAAKLLEAFPANQKAGTVYHPQAKPAGLVEALTSRELEVLQLIAAGDSNRTIAEKLVITVSAVKKHTANIYGKLNVNSRTQAVARARQLRLLPAGD